MGLIVVTIYQFRFVVGTGSVAVKKELYTNLLGWESAPTFILIKKEDQSRRLLNTISSDKLVLLNI
jgi:hypothetical protein